MWRIIKSELEYSNNYFMTMILLFIIFCIVEYFDLVITNYVYTNNAIKKEIAKSGIYLMVIFRLFEGLKNNRDRNYLVLPVVLKKLAFLRIIIEIIPFVIYGILFLFFFEVIDGSHKEIMKSVFEIFLLIFITMAGIILIRDIGFNERKKKSTMTNYYLRSIGGVIIAFISGLILLSLVPEYLNLKTEDQNLFYLLAFLFWGALILFVDFKLFLKRKSYLI
jgi:hypothetical protein